MQNNSKQDFSDEDHCRFHLHIKDCDDIVFYKAIYYVSIILAVILVITAGGLWLKRRLYVRSSQKVAFMDGYLLWQTLHASTRIISGIITLTNLFEGEYMVLELLYDIPFYCDQVSVILLILGILLVIPDTRSTDKIPASPRSQRSFQISIPSHKNILWFFRIFSFLIFPPLATFALLTGYFHSSWKVRSDDKSYYVDVEARMIRAHYIVYAISWILIAICFAYFGRKVKAFAEGSIGLLMDSEMDYTRYDRLRLMRRFITRMNIVNGFLCAKYLLFATGATIAALQLEIIFSTDWIFEFAAALVTTLPLASMILCTLLILCGDINPEKTFDTHYSHMSHSRHNLLTWDCTMELPSQQSDTNESSLLPPPPSYKDNDSSQQYVLVQEIGQNQQNEMNDYTTISTNHHSSRIQNSDTMLPDIIVSSPPETIVIEKRTSHVARKSKFVVAWVLDQHERTLIEKLPSSDFSEDNSVQI